MRAAHHPTREHHLGRAPAGAGPPMGPQPPTTSSRILRLAIVESPSTRASAVRIQPPTHRPASSSWTSCGKSAPKSARRSRRWGQGPPRSRLLHPSPGRQSSPPARPAKAAYPTPSWLELQFRRAPVAPPCPRLASLVGSRGSRSGRRPPDLVRPPDRHAAPAHPVSKEASARAASADPGSVMDRSYMPASATTSPRLGRPLLPALTRGVERGPASEVSPYTKVDASVAGRATL